VKGKLKFVRPISQISITFLCSTFWLKIDILFIILLTNKKLRKMKISFFLLKQRYFKKRFFVYSLASSKNHQKYSILQTLSFSLMLIIFLRLSPQFSFFLFCLNFSFKFTLLGTLNICLFDKSSRTPILRVGIGFSYYSNEG